MSKPYNDIRGVHSASSDVTLPENSFKSDKQLQEVQTIMGIDVNNIENERNIAIQPFQIWKHFKGSLAVIVNVTKHSETGEELVNYKCTGGGNHKEGFYSRPKSMFLEKVDKEKYPNATQEYRFELYEGKDNLNSDLGKLLKRLYATDFTFTYDNNHRRIDVRTSNDVIIRISCVDESINKNPYQVVELERIKGTENKFKKRNTEYWTFKEVMRYLCSECDG